VSGDTIELVVVSLLFVAVLVAMIKEWVPIEYVALTVPVILLVTGILSTDQILRILSNNALFTVAAMFVLSAALERTGCIDYVGSLITQRVGGAPLVGIAGFLLFAVVVSAFINNTPVVVVLIPVAFRLAQHYRVAPSRLLMPLSYAAILGGTCTLIGTSTNIIVDGVARDYGQPAFGIFEITGLGVIVAGVGIVYLATIGFRLLPDRQTVTGTLADLPPRSFLTEVIAPPGSRLVGMSLEEAKLLNLRNARLIDVIRSDESLRRDLGGVRLAAGDRLVFKAAVGGLMTLRDRVGLTFDPKSELEEVGTRTSELFEGIIGPRSSYVGHRLAELNLRRRYGAYIVALHRQGDATRGNFEEDELQIGDTLLMEGPRQGMHRMMEAGDIINLAEPRERPFRPAKAPIAIAAVLGVVILAALDVMPIAGLALIATLVVLATGCIERSDTYRSLDWKVLIVIFSMISLGTAMEKVGALEAVIAGIDGVFGGLSPLAMLWFIYVLAWILTEFVSNNAVGILLTPIAIGLAHSLGVDPRPFIVAVMFAASAAFATPVGYQTNTLVYAAGGYRYTDFVKVGVPLNLITWVVACLVIPEIWPLTPR